MIDNPGIFRLGETFRMRYLALHLEGGAVKVMEVDPFTLEVHKDDLQGLLRTVFSTYSRAPIKAIRIIEEAEVVNSCLSTQLSFL